MKKIISIIFIIFILLFTSKVYGADNDQVYVDKNKIDSNYHRITCNFITPNKYHSITVKEAFDIGYRRCPICSPPMSQTEEIETKKEHDEKLEEAAKITEEIGTVTTNNNFSTKHVYISKNTSKYHLAGCDYIQGQPYKVTLEYAKSHGYGACKHCKPYEEIQSSINFKTIFEVAIIFLAVIVIFIWIVKRKPKKNKMS